MPKLRHHAKEIQLNKVQDTGPPHLEGFNRLQNSYLLGGHPYRRIALQSRGDWCLEFTGFLGQLCVDFACCPCSPMTCMWLG